MNDHLNSAGSSTNPQPQQPRSGRSWLILPSVALAAALTGAVATSAMSQYGDGAGMPMHFMGGGGHDFDPARAEQRADRMVRHLAIEVDATNEQTEKLRAVVKTALKDLIPLREKIKSARGRVRELLAAPTIDRAALEVAQNRADGQYRCRDAPRHPGACRCWRRFERRTAPQARGTA